MSQTDLVVSHSALAAFLSPGTGINMALLKREDEEDQEEEEEKEDQEGEEKKKEQ